MNLQPLILSKALQHFTDGQPDEKSEAELKAYLQETLTIYMATLRSQSTVLSDDVYDPLERVHITESAQAFVATPDGSVGFWYPLTASQYSVEVETNGYAEKAMHAASFGAATTLTALNHYTWYLAEVSREAPDDESRRAIDELGNVMVEKYHQLREFVFDLSEQGLLDGEAIAGFID
jgi:hypothetical protein